MSLKNLLLAALTVASLAVLIALGAWQWQRKAEKEALIAEIEAASAQPPLSLAQLDSTTAEFSPISLENGRFLLEKHVVLIGFSTPQTVFIPLSTPAGCSYLVQGFAADDPAALAPLLAAAPTQIAVLRKAPKANPYLPKDDPAADKWYALKPDAMLAQRGLKPCRPGFYLALPQSLIAGGPSAPNPAADPARQAGFVGPDRHFGYALTWWGLAAALLGVAAGYIWRRR